MIDLNGSELKLDRAKRHISELEYLFNAFIHENPYRLEINKNTDSDGVIIQVVFDKPIPFEVYAVIGDIVHNIRSALDHLAAIAIRSNGGTIRYKSGFPIYKNKSDLDRGISSKLKGASDQFIDFVMQANPCGDNPDSSVYVLSKLNNFDKHDSLIPAAGVFKVRNIVVTNKHGVEMFTINEASVRGDGTVDIASADGEGLKLKEDSNATIKIVFTNTGIIDGFPVVDSLKSIHVACSKIIHNAALVL